MDILQTMSASTPLAGEDRGHYGLQDRNHYPARRDRHPPWPEIDKILLAEAGHQARAS
jgi:hypothetical protein